jgi:hypothetical protein
MELLQNLPVSGVPAVDGLPALIGFRNIEFRTGKLKNYELSDIVYWTHQNYLLPISAVNIPIWGPPYPLS